MKTTSNQPISNLTSIEQALSSALVPVSPGPGFVRRLGHQLRNNSVSESPAAKPGLKEKPGYYTLVGLAGIFTTLMVLAAGARTAAAILGAIGLISEFNKRVKDKDPGSTAAAG